MIISIFRKKVWIIAISLFYFAIMAKADAQCSLMVLAEYQAWHGLPSHYQAWEGWSLLSNQCPYYSSDPNVITRHIQEAKKKGINGFVVDCYTYILFFND